MFSNVDIFEKWLSGEIKAQGLSVTKLSKISGVHPNTIRNYLARRCEPTFYNAWLLVNALGYSLGAIKK
jgi:lambda repressor-like predicted transcriptional regulator